MLLTAVLFLLLGLSRVECSPPRVPPKTPGLPTIEELAAKGGYSVTNYEVMTEDGYSLWLHRIGKNTGPPVLMQHAITFAAEQWLTRGPRRDLAFLLLNEGFDVWLSNQRGTVFNEYSVKYNKSDAKFWDFSFHESGYYDIPANIDFILANRGVEKLFYIGHSLGSTVFLVMASTKPEYNDKIQTAVLLAPVAIPPDWDELSPIFKIISKNGDLINFLVTITGLHQFGGNRNPMTVFTLRDLCTGIDVMKTICLGFIELLLGKHRSNLDEKEWSQLLPFTGAGTSVKTLRHLLQVYYSGEFLQFDYGLDSNLKKYGNTKPPAYPLGRVTAPVAIYWGYNDPFLSKRSVGKLESVLPNVIYSKPVSDPMFTHLDMFLGDNAPIVLFPLIINLLKSLSR